MVFCALVGVEVPPNGCVHLILSQKVPLKDNAFPIDFLFFPDLLQVLFGLLLVADHLLDLHSNSLLVLICVSRRSRQYVLLALAHLFTEILFHLARHCLMSHLLLLVDHTLGLVFTSKADNHLDIDLLRRLEANEELLLLELQSLMAIGITFLVEFHLCLIREVGLAIC